MRQHVGHSLEGALKNVLTLADVRDAVQQEDVMEEYEASMKPCQELPLEGAHS